MNVYEFCQKSVLSQTSFREQLKNDTENWTQAKLKLGSHVSEANFRAIRPTGIPCLNNHEAPSMKRCPLGHVMDYEWGPWNNNESWIIIHKNL